MSRKKVRMVKPDDPMFVAKRAWDYGSEVGYMKRIENAFQELAVKIIDETISHIGNAEKKIVNEFCALWYARAWHRHLLTQEIQAKGVSGGGNLTLDQEEMLEKNGYLFMRTGGRVPARQLNGIRIHSLIYRQFDCLSSAQWGIIQAKEGEFIVADIPERAIVPLTPTLCLMSPSPNGIILKQGVAEINRLSRAASHAYFFARDFSKCPC